MPVYLCGAFGRTTEFLDGKSRGRSSRHCKTRGRNDLERAVPAAAFSPGGAACIFGTVAAAL